MKVNRSKVINRIAELNETQLQMANRARISSSYMSELLNNLDKDYQIRSIVTLAKALNVKPSAILDYDEIDAGV